MIEALITLPSRLPISETGVAAARNLSRACHEPVRDRRPRPPPTPPQYFTSSGRFEELVEGTGVKQREYQTSFSPHICHLGGRGAHLSGQPRYGNISKGGGKEWEDRQWISAFDWLDLGAVSVDDHAEQLRRFQKWCYEFLDEHEFGLEEALRKGLAPEGTAPAALDDVREVVCVDVAGVCDAAELARDADFQAQVDLFNLEAKRRTDEQFRASFAKNNPGQKNPYDKSLLETYEKLGVEREEPLEDPEELTPEEVLQRTLEKEGAVEL